MLQIVPADAYFQSDDGYASVFVAHGDNAEFKIFAVFFSGIFHFFKVRDIGLP